LFGLVIICEAKSIVMTYVGTEGEVVVVVLQFLRGGERVADFDVVRQEVVAIVIDPIEHLKISIFEVCLVLNRIG
jgi:hypothetical protein